MQDPCSRRSSTKRRRTIPRAPLRSSGSNKERRRRSRRPPNRENMRVPYAKKVRSRVLEAAIAVVIVSACSTAPEGEVLAGKACDGEGRCVSGYECVDGICVRASEIGTGGKPGTGGAENTGGEANTGGSDA